MTEQTPTLIARIYTWIYGINDYRENNYIPLRNEQKPRSECWHENIPSNHASHISEPNPTLSHLAAVGNFISDSLIGLIG